MASRPAEKTGTPAPDASELALHWLAVEEIPRLIVDSNLSIEWLNLSAERELRLRRDISRRDNALVLTHPAHQAELLALLGRCGEESGSLCLRRVNGEGHLLLRIQSLPVHRFGLTFRQCGAEFRPAYADLQGAFQLTRSEAKVLLQLADGYSAPEVAERLGVSPATTRSHIKSIYAKLNVRSREDLFSRIRAYQI